MSKVTPSKQISHQQVLAAFAYTRSLFYFAEVNSNLNVLIYFYSSFLFYIIFLNLSIFYFTDPKFILVILAKEILIKVFVQRCI